MPGVLNQGPLVSVVVPCLNRIEFIDATLESILSQDYANMECIVADGGSTDGTVDRLKAYGNRIQWFSEPDAGPFAAINRGWAASKGEVLAWLNADDVWLPGAVRTVARHFEEDPSMDVLYGGCGGVAADGRLLWFEKPREWSVERAVLRYEPVIHQPACFIRRAAVEKVGGLYPDWCHDHDLWIRLGLAGAKFRSTDAHLANCRVWAKDAHKDPGLMVPAVQRVVERAFANPMLPERLKPYESTSKSNAYARCLQYLLFQSPAHWLEALRLIYLAIRAEPKNTPAVLMTAASMAPRLVRSMTSQLALRAGQRRGQAAGGRSH